MSVGSLTNVAEPLSREGASAASFVRESRDDRVMRALQQSSKLCKRPESWDAGSLPSLAEAGRRPAASKIKRLMDIVGAGFGLLFLAPFLLLVMLIIRLESAGPALFRQRRTGRGGVPFVIYKFRTMRCLEDGQKIQQAERDDCRTTRIGAFLRRSSIDELPQLFNVLKGDMSLIGPRPHAVAHDEFYAPAIADYHARFLTRPGISGLAQVSGLRGATPNVGWMAARVALDLEYIRHWSPGLDVRILLQTLALGPFDPAAF